MKKNMNARKATTKMDGTTKKPDDPTKIEKIKR